MASTINIIDAINDRRLFQPWFRGKSWDGWKCILKAAFGLKMNVDERYFLRTIAKRNPPTRRVKQLWIVAGRRAGKDSIASVIATFAAALFDPKNLRRGERASVFCLAVDREQSKIVLGFIRSFFHELDLLNNMVERETKNGFELNNRVDISVTTNSFRHVRGRTVLCAIFDEAAYWRSDESARPDDETYRAVIPSMATIPESMLIGMSSPYRKSGLLYDKFKNFYGKDDDNVLVVKAPSRTLNPTLSQSIIDEALEADPAAANAEWLGEFRDDIGGSAPLELIEAGVDRGVIVRAPITGLRYHSFCDPSGGARDSFACAITHAERDQIYLDALLEIKAPFFPNSATREVASLLKQFGLTSTVSDRFAAGYSIDAFRDAGIRLKHSEQNRSELYLQALPLFTSGRVHLIDNKRLINQFASLERKTSSLGKDAVNHPPGGSDDLCNAAAGALVLAAQRSGPMKISQTVMNWASRMDDRLAARGIAGTRSFFTTTNER